MPKIYTPEHDRLEPEEFEPVVLFKTGIYGSSELGFMPRIAHLLGARLVSGDNIKRSVFGGPEHVPHKVGSQHVKITQAREMLAGLLVEEDVVVDAHYNTAHTRANGPVLMADAAEAFVVAIQFDLPNPEFAKRRIRRWMADGTMVAPVKSWKKGPLDAIDNAMGNIQKISANEPGIDHVVQLDGRLPLEQMVECTMAELETVDILPATA